MSEGIPDVVQRFVRRHISSVEAIEVLLLLRGSPGRTWTAHEVSKELYSQPESAGHRLEDLASRGLLVRADDGYRYQPRTRELREAVEALADTYARRRVRLIGFIFSAPQHPGTAISDAFRLRKERDR